MMFNDISLLFMLFTLFMCFVCGAAVMVPIILFLKIVGRLVVAAGLQRHTSRKHKCTTHEIVIAGTEG